MSGFFSDLRGSIPEPDVVMNSGPVPSQDPSGWPVGMNGTPDGVINAASDLLGGVQPYSYGKAARLSTQAAYLNIPHVTQRLVPTISIPLPLGRGMFQLNHQVDDGDIAFIVRCMFSPYEMVSQKKKYLRQGVLHAIDPVVNLATVNYLLHGIQRYGFHDDHPEWHTLWVAMGIDEHFPGLAAWMRLCTDDLDYVHRKLQTARRLVVEYVIQNIIKPFGIPRGSEKQGGQHQGLVNKSVTWPVDLVTSLVIDGRVINMINFWKADNISAGDDLILYLCEKDTREYVLSHHPSSIAHNTFEKFTRKTKTFKDPIEKSMQDHFNQFQTVKQLMEDPTPDVFKNLKTTDIVRHSTETLFQLVPGVSSTENVQNAVWKNGYWHIARSQVMQYKHDMRRQVHSDATSVVSGNLLQATFQPVWIEPLSAKRRKIAIVPKLSDLNRALHQALKDMNITSVITFNLPIDVAELDDAVAKFDTGPNIGEFVTRFTSYVLDNESLKTWKMYIETWYNAFQDKCKEVQQLEHVIPYYLRMLRDWLHMFVDFYQEYLERNGKKWMPIAYKNQISKVLSPTTDTQQDITNRGDMQFHNLSLIPDEVILCWTKRLTRKALNKPQVVFDQAAAITPEVISATITPATITPATITPDETSTTITPEVTYTKKFKKVNAQNLS
jgi:hypothetical protein